MTIQDTGPLDWRVGIVDKAGRPTPEFQRRWAIQRDNNSQIGSVSFGSGPPSNSPTPSDGEEYVDTSSVPYILYVGNGGTWNQVGVGKFTQLSDVPNSYTASGSKLVRVNSGATGLEFDSLSAILDGLGLTQGDILYRGAAGWVALPPGTAGQVLSTGGTGANPSWVTGGGGGSGFSYSPPTTSTFTWLNQPSGATISAITGGVQVYCPNQSGRNIALLREVATFPSTPWTRWSAVSLSPTTGANSGAIFVADGSGKLIDLRIQNFEGSSFGPTYCIGLTAYNGSVTDSIFSGSFQIPLYIGIEDDGTNLNFLLSYDGATAITLCSQSRTAYFSAGPTMVGVDVDSYSAMTTMNVAHWAATLPA